MENKKKKKRLIISLFSLVIVFIISLTAYFLFKPKNKPNDTHKNYDIDRYFLAQTAVFNEKYSQNFNGNYVFSRVNFVYLSNFDPDQKSEIFKYFKVKDTMGLIGTLTNKKLNELSLIKENLKIENDKFYYFKNSKICLTGSIFGNDDLSFLYDKNNNLLCTVSLTNLSTYDLKSLTIDDKIEYFGDEIYLTKTLNIEINNVNYALEIIYVYKLEK